MRSSPRQKLSESAIKAWRISSSIIVLILFCIGFVLLMGAVFESEFSIWTFIALVMTMLVIAGLTIMFIPEIRWRRWHYQIDEHEIDIQSGIIIITRTLVPVNRVQHVNTRQGPLLRWYDLADVTISTAATTHRIPALEQETADKVRDQISNLARLAQEDV